VIRLGGSVWLISKSSYRYTVNAFSFGSRRLRVDTADTSAVSNSDLDVTLFSPSRAPGILDEKVVVAVFCTVANGKDTVVKLSSTLFRSNDTSLVSLESNSVSLDCDRHRLLVKSGLELIRRVRSDIIETSDANFTVFLVVMTSSEFYVSMVRVFAFSLEG
jgi:hypothetical protein